LDLAWRELMKLQQKNKREGIGIENLSVLVLKSILKNSRGASKGSLVHTVSLWWEE